MNHLAPNECELSVTRRRATPGKMFSTPSSRRLIRDGVLAENRFRQQCVVLAISGLQTNRRLSRHVRDTSVSITTSAVFSIN